MTKIKVIDIDVAKLDPNAVHLIIFNSIHLTGMEMEDISERLDGLGIKAIYAQSQYPQDALKVYSIPRERNVRGKNTEV